MSYRIVSGIMFISLMGLTDCSVMEPLDQSYHWRNLGVYDANMAAQVENKRDLQSGRPLPPSDGQTAVTAVERWREDRVKSLGRSGLAELSMNGEDQGSSGGGPATSSSSGGGGQ
ncbi:hypothetical protein GOB86_03280 [Acetobacter lambici]|uniref:Uncharacterized protein n=1 Tax=Acetobacter lambici TaxID=1332824 RepID=A0ABT1F1V7_9PROT|nr:hypothetical protein [Acetobacter lambici]MCP1243106.1 hypothetical protein [Acetobacter lambici]MCP1259176.1 hypothetical protein [Acetobacter lambici]NHO56104.1 hypothetical protein [Acetobacter lambici]